MDIKLSAKIIIGFILLSAVGGVIFGVMKIGQKNPAETRADIFVDSATSSDWTAGNKDAKILLIEYSDFQCPACAMYHSAIKRLLQELGSDVIFVYRHFPLSQIHKNAELAARAAEAAGRQGKFWEMHGLLFENQREWSNQGNAQETFVKYAESLGLNIYQFKNDIESREIKNKVGADYKSGLRFKVNATPTFFLNGQKLRNPGSYEEFKSLIQAAALR